MQSDPRQLGYGVAHVDGRTLDAGDVEQELGPSAGTDNDSELESRSDAGSEDGKPSSGPEPEKAASIGRSQTEDARMAAEELLRGAQMRIECAKVCAPAQMADLVEGSHTALTRLRGVKALHGLCRLLPVATAEYQALCSQWQQRSGTIRVVVRVRPSTSFEDEGEVEAAAVKVLEGARNRGLSVSVKRGGRAEVHTFKRFDYVLDAQKEQEAVFRELQAMLPSAGPGGFTGPAQSACILAYGQTGSGKTHTMHGGNGVQQGLVPRVLSEVFRSAQCSGATISLSAVEIYNDTAYDLLDGTRRKDTNSAEGAAGGGRGFQVGRLPPPPGLNFRHGCASALDQATCVPVGEMEDAHRVLDEAAERRSTRSTCFNATSSRSHSLVLVHAHLPGAALNEPSLRLAFVDLAGSERLPAAEAGGLVAEESRHINLSLSSLGSVIHALRHRSNHLPYRACLLTRLLEPFFGACGRVLLCVCVSRASLRTGNVVLVELC
jgi:hypothetical protein